MLISKILYKTGFLAGIACLVGAAGCGGSGVVIPHPTGNYSNASFKGSYVYAINGVLVDNSPYSEAGVIVADGNGHITGGIDGFAGTNTGGALQSSAAVTGTYTIANDGTGQILLGATGLGTVAGVSQISLAVTLASTSQAALMEADSFAEGTGTAQLQDATAITAAPAGTFVFRMHQEFDPQNSTSASQVGFFTIGSGSLSGSMDQNLFPQGSAPVTLNSGTVNAPTTFGTGAASFTDSSSHTTNFLYYIVNSSKFVMLASNPGAVGSGSAEAQSGAVGNGLQGTYAFGSSGDDFTFNEFNPGVATVGEFTGSGATVSAGHLDALQDGSNYSQNVGFTGAATTGTNNPSPQGRVLVTLNESGTSVPVIFWMVSPTRAFFLDNLTTRCEDGTADLQTTTSFSAATFKGQYAILMNGIDTTPEGLGRIGTLQFDGASHLTLNELANASQSGSGASSPGVLSGTYLVGSGGRFTGSMTGGNGGLDFVGYGVSGSQAYVMQTDQGANTFGTITLQQ